MSPLLQGLAANYRRADRHQSSVSCRFFTRHRTFRAGDWWRQFSTIHGARTDRHGDDAEFLRQYFFFADDLEGAGQRRRCADAALELGRIACRVRFRRRFARLGGGACALASDVAVRSSRSASSRLYATACGCSITHALPPRPANGDLGRKIRSVGGGNKFCCHATGFSLRHVLFHRAAARTALDRQQIQPLVQYLLD